jgi:hypothetical protein
MLNCFSILVFLSKVSNFGSICLSPFIVMVKIFWQNHPSLIIFLKCWGLFGAQICLDYKWSWQHEFCLNRTLNKNKSYINPTLIKVSMPEIFVKIICINQSPVWSELKSWSQSGLV